MQVSTTEVFDHESKQLGIFLAHDLERFIERTRNGHVHGFAVRIAVLGVTPDEQLIAAGRNGEAGFQCVWKGDEVTFTRAFHAPEDPSGMPRWVKDL